MWGIFLGLLSLFWGADFCFPLNTQVRYSQVILDQKGDYLQIFLTPGDKWRLKTELSEISPVLRQTLLYKEDKYFYYHPGLNLLAIGRAFLNNLWQGRTTSGASTITMQVVRLLEPRPRTYGSKLVEAFRALQLEWHLSKDEIFQLYLNLVPYGGNLEGVKAAAWFYFQKKPEKLSLAEITALTIIPNRPSERVVGRHNSRIRQARNQWLHRFARDGVFPLEMVQNALREDLRAFRHEAPRIAPHFCQWLHEQFPDKITLATTLHREKQQKVQQLAYNYVQRLKLRNIRQTAVLVINNRTQAVEVYVGSADFADKEQEGEVDGIQAIRSPGSTLKPLAYALAFDQGNITPKTVLADVPADYAGFEPENFTRNFVGRVSAEEALVRSLNIPAVSLVKETGLSFFLQKLKQAGFQQIRRDEKKLGLSTVLGGCGASLWEITHLYHSLARQGRYQRAYYVKGETRAPTQVLFSEAAAYVITEMLARGQRPDLPEGFENTYRIPKVAWKTGTSFGRHDAWSIGYNANYTIGVWVGNFSGESVAQLIGAEVATPLLFEVFNTLDYNPPQDWFHAPKSLQVRWVCAESGLPPADFCHNQVADVYVPLVSPSQRCSHQREVIVSEDGRTSYCFTCMPAQGYRKAWFPDLSPALSAFYEATGIAYDKAPPHASHCTRLSENQAEAPVIVSPSTAHEYLIERDDPPEMALECKAAHHVQTVHWYLNEQYYRSASPREKVFFKAQPGQIKIACIDDQGRATQASILVRYQ
ncbi:MAG: penicillin-binding protein 1C [Microscillaceae bacterium]